MNTIVVSYSMTGNNDTLAQSVAKALKARHVAVSETKKRDRTMGTIVKDLLLGLTPRVTPGADALENADAVVLAGPVWIGQVATPLRTYMKRLQKMNCPYAFLSISGGADGPNVKLTEELTRRVKRAPAAVVDLHIADLLPAESKPERRDTSAYRLGEEIAQKLTAQALQQLKDFAKEE